MSENLSLEDLIIAIKPLAEKYHIQEVYIFGSYARNEETENSDVDLLVYGGEKFKLTSIFSFAEELRKILHRDVDAFEIREINRTSDFYRNIMRERIEGFIFLSNNGQEQSLRTIQNGTKSFLRLMRISILTNLMLMAR